MEGRVYSGWAQVAFVRELERVLTPAWLGRVPLMVVRRDDGVAVFGATCPHRGAHLAYGGQLEGDAVVCPFHGRHIRLGSSDDHPYCVPAYRTLELGGAIYVLPDERREHGFTEYLRQVERTHYLIAGFAMDARITPEYVIENALDADHFHAVHGLKRRPTLTLVPGDRGELIIDGTFDIGRPNKWQADEVAAGDPGVTTGFRAHVFSPTLVATELGSPELPKVVVTAATPTPNGDTVIRVLLALPRSSGGTPPTVEAIGSLMAGSRTAFEQDLVIWEHLDRDAPSRFEAGDELVLAFHEFCRGFAAPAAP